MDKDILQSITLRPLLLTDIDHFMVWASDDRVTRFCTWDTITSKDDGIDYIKDNILTHPWFRAICLANTPIGYILVTAFSGGDRCRAEIGYVLATKYWGKGIATKAVKMVLHIVFTEWSHIQRIEAFVDVENLGSQKVLEKAGFLREGVLRKYFIIKGRPTDLVVFSILSTDPIP